MKFKKEFVQHIIQHDNTAFAQFYEQSIDVFFRYVSSRYTLSPTEIEDLLSEVYLKIRNNVEKYDSKYSFGQFIWTILKNHCKDYFKKSKSLHFSSLEYKHQDGSITNVVDEFLQEDNLGDIINIQFESKLVQKALSSLPQESQDLIYERYVLQFSYEMLAYNYTSSEEAIRKKLSRIIQKLRILLQKTGI